MSDVLQSQAYVCELCNKIFKSQVNFGRHMKSVHGNEHLWPCTICKKEFKRISSLKQHIAQIHPKVYNAGKQMLIFFFHSCHLFLF